MVYNKKPYKKWSSKGNPSSFTLNSEAKVTLNPSPLTLNQGRPSPLTLNQGRPEPKRKRGKLASLMSEDAKATATIHELSYDFGCRITRLFQYLTEDAEYKEYVQSKQIYRSGTSIGANVRESKHAQSEADFLSKMSIAYKEADETDFWLNLLHDNGYLDDTQYNSLKKDIDRILKILSSIVKTMKEKIEESKKK